MLIDEDKGFKVHVKNVRALAIEMFKVSNNYSKSLMSEIFDKRNNVYNFRDFVISFPCLNNICMNYCNLKFIFLLHTFYLYFSWVTLISMYILLNIELLFFISVYMTYGTLIFIVNKLRQH